MVVIQESSRFRAQRRIDRMPNARVREMCVVKNGVNERTDESVFFWLGHFERVENSRTSSWVSEETVYKKSYWTGLKVWMRMMRERNDRRGSL